MEIFNSLIGTLEAARWLPLVCFISTVNCQNGPLFLSSLKIGHHLGVLLESQRWPQWPSTRRSWLDRWVLKPFGPGGLGSCWALSCSLSHGWSSSAGSGGPCLVLNRTQRSYWWCWDQQLHASTRTASGSPCFVVYRAARGSESAGSCWYSMIWGQSGC